MRISVYTHQSNPLRGEKGSVSMKKESISTMNNGAAFQIAEHDATLSAPRGGEATKASAANLQSFMQLYDSLNRDERRRIYEVMKELKRLEGKADT